MQHKLSDDDATSSLKNVFYTLQANYSKSGELLQDPRHGDNYFAYGYVGKFIPQMITNMKVVHSDGRLRI